MSQTSQKLGRDFEQLVVKQNAEYLKAGAAHITQGTARISIQHRGPGGLVRGRSRKGLVDFEGPVSLLGGRMIAFDCKSTKGSRFPLSNIPSSQITCLENRSQAGGAVCFFFICFSELERYFIAPLAWLKPWWDAWWEGEFTGEKAPASIPLKEFEMAAIEVTRQGKRLDYLQSIVNIAS